MTWSVHVPSGPCESFRERAALACTTAGYGSASITVSVSASPVPK